LRKAKRCEDPDVKVIMDAGAGSVEWVTQEFARTDLHDKRLDRRLLKTAEHQLRLTRSRKMLRIHRDNLQTLGGHLIRYLHEKPL